jgi:hypothetical protein
VSPALACKALSPDFDAVIAIEVTLPDSGVVAVGDTLRPQGKALDGRGDSTAAVITWNALDSTIQVVDSFTGATVGRRAGTGRLIARSGALISNPAIVTVVASLDSITALGRTVDTVIVSTPDSLSDSLAVQAFSAGGSVAGRQIVLSLDFPPGGTGVTLVPGDTLATDGTGIAVFQVRLTGVNPDSAIVSASAKRSDGTPAPGSPIHFVVEFLP